jgi:DNA-binding XRE family transcriptional regulator
MNPIKHARVSRDLLLKDAATVLGTNAGNLSRIEQGRQLPSVQLAKRIAQYYELTLEEIFSRAPSEAA